MSGLSYCLLQATAIGSSCCNNTTDTNSMADIQFALNYSTRLGGLGVVLQDEVLAMASFRFHYRLGPPPQLQQLRHRRCSC